MSNSAFPYDIYELIISYGTVGDLLVWRGVCRDWQELVEARNDIWHAIWATKCQEFCMYLQFHHTWPRLDCLVPTHLTPIVVDGTTYVRAWRSCTSLYVADLLRKFGTILDSEAGYGRLIPYDPGILLPGEPSCSCYCCACCHCTYPAHCNSPAFYTASSISEDSGGKYLYQYLFLQLTYALRIKRGRGSDLRKTISRLCRRHIPLRKIT